MKRTTLLHAELSHAIAQLGHGDMIAIGDAGLPIPDGPRRIDLAVCPGLPAVACPQHPREIFQPIAPPRREDHGAPPVGEARRQRLADTRRGAGDPSPGAVRLAKRHGGTPPLPVVPAVTNVT